MAGGPSPAVALPARRRRFAQKTNWGAVLFFLGPTTVAFILFMYFPLVRAVYMSLFDYSWVKPPGKFIGLMNYVHTFSNLTFKTDLWNTVVLFLFSLALGFWVPILQALLLDQLRGVTHRVAKYLYLLPMALPGVGAYLIWKWIWNPDYGLANALLGLFHIKPLLWLSDPGLVKLTLRLPYLIGGGMSVFIYLAAIQGVSTELYEAAEIDGAGAWQRLLRITLPQIWHVVTILFILTLSVSLLAFDDVFVLTHGGPGNASATIVYGIFLEGFQLQLMGQAAAWAVLVLLITLVATSVQLRFRLEEQR